ncbi:hypothetical protein N9973_00285 [bacterium]|nr:hypothetical protein [bacterium]
MKYNYVIATGDSTVTGSQLNQDHKNQKPDFGLSSFQKTYFRLDEDGNEKEYPFYFDDRIITGSKTSLMSFNSQTMLEVDDFSIITRGAKNYYIVSDNDESGNYIVDVDNSQGKIIFDPVLTLGKEDVVQYDKRDYSSHFGQLKKTRNDNSWTTYLTLLFNKINNSDPTADIAEMEEKYFLFFNGQKILDFSSNTDLNTVTGTLFAIKKQNNTDEITGVADSYGTKFIENHVDFYFNGMEQDPEDYIQTNTGVYMIETGLDSSVYLTNQQTETYSL